MTRRMGWRGKAANLRYGLLGKKLVRLLKLRKPEFAIEVLCTFAEDDKGQVVWIMRCK